MNKHDKERVIKRYDARLDEYGASIEALASGREDRRQLRFRVLEEVGITEGANVLDLGCGLGDLYAYLQRRGLAVSYVGVDINPRLISEAANRFPGVDFRVLDIQEEHPGEFDYVVSTSCFNLRLSEEDNYAFVESILRISLGIARKGVAVDFLTSYVDFRGVVKEAFYYQPERLLTIAKGITKRVCVRHDYPLFEFCVYLYPDFQGWGR